MTFIDNAKGLSIATGGEGEFKKTYLKDIEIYGEQGLNNDDCPD